MTTKYLILGTAFLAITSGGALAQGALIGTDRVDERVEDIEQDAAEDIARGDDAARFGPEGIRQGFSGTLAITGSASSGNTENVDLSGAGRINYGAGLWTHSLGFGMEYGEANEVKNEEQIFATYDVTRELGQNFYAFGLGRAEWDEFGPLQRDAFLGVGVGYRIFNREDLAWRVQLGGGARFTEDQADVDEREAAAIAGSRFYYAFSDTVYVTNDTDVLHSDTNTLVTNELGLNYRVTEVMTTRMSLKTDYDSDPAPGFENTDNRLGLSLIYGF